MTPPARALGVVSVSRSDWGHLLPVLEEIRRVPDLSLLLLVAGMHLEADFGLTVRAIEADGWPIAARIPMSETDDSPEGIARSTAQGVAGFARAFTETRPDLLVVLGDRFEMLAAAVAALPFALPVAHIHGGEASEGAMDNQIRHAISKLAHLHLASAPVHATRIAQLGEERWRIHAVGAPGLDRIRPAALLSREDTARALGIPVAARWLLATFHPVTLESADAGAQVDELLAALEKIEGALVITYPNADTAGRVIIDRIEEFAARQPRCRLARSLGDRLYLSLLSHAAVMVGNSSSGLIEAPSFGLPVVNVGSRQRGRLRGRNVVDVGYGREDIVRGVEAALTPGFRAGLREAANPYGDGRAAPRIVELLRAVSLDARLIQKRSADAE
ncbi:MAG: UDP-N-acetylglucosamine 2-epimerase (hydrolyzing) [Candidatus Rokubacteria bacterium]|nr:UDP-N-acetylglucosamine 2-epimerase (hydrolyzing) [Candidatus Rokubacteria bacterium]MBI3105847.1 UDP-N-acetylglucosamine 2-epimerase (hydrolyzing) [Candidatus Rokubacteria bacterium]